MSMDFLQLRIFHASIMDYELYMISVTKSPLMNYLEPNSKLVALLRNVEKVCFLFNCSNVVDLLITSFHLIFIMLL